MKILIGVCGIGKGHCVRQYELSKELMRRGHEIRILTYNEGINFFKTSNIRIYDVYVPYIVFKGKKVNILDCIKRNIFKFIPGFIKNNNVFKKLIKDDFIPDLCISDYEPTVAKIAYKLNKPLFNIDQHSKFIYMKDEFINGYSCTEEKRRLQLFFPKSDYKFVVSFYKLQNEILPDNLEILYPMISNELKMSVSMNKQQNQIIVYFSKYINITIEQSIEEIINIFNKFPNYTFIFFSTEYYGQNIKNNKNVIIMKNDRTSFINELSKSNAVISTAGHTLISEALYCGIPTFAIPLPTFDQNYCGRFITDNNIGYSSNKITFANLKEFLSNINEYKANIKTCKNLVPITDTRSYIVDKIEKFVK